MTIHVYAFTWNEQRMLPFFLRHYTSFADRLVVYDNMSDDGSRAILESCPLVEVRDWDTGGYSDEDSLRDLKNNAWKESRGTADWVMVVDVDEFIYHAELVSYLERMKGHAVLKPRGYQMWHDRFPTGSGQIYDEVKIGERCPEFFDKLSVFDPMVIADINYHIGSHCAEPTLHPLMHLDEDCTIPEPAPVTPSELKLLHFKHLGWEYLYERQVRMRQRIHPAARERGWFCYELTRETCQAIWRESRCRCEVVV